MATGPPCKALKLFSPALSEIASVLKEGLSKNFASVEVSVVDCPDLSQPPYSLAAPGLCGDQKVVDVGGPAFLLPLADRSKLYRLKDVANQVGTTQGLVVGAGAGPWPVVGVNNEMMANVRIDGDKMDIHTKIAKVNTETLLGEASSVDTDQFAVLGNLYISKGQRDGKVLEVKASKRTGDQNYMSCIRACLADKYGDKPVGLGGTFLIEQGKAKLHIMSDFSECPITTDEQVNNWLKFYEYDAPLTAVGYLVSHDPGYNLRVEHFHCFTDRGVGGHYHYDVTPDDVVYRGYFGLADTLYRVDQPENTSNLGKD